MKFQKSNTQGMITDRVRHINFLTQKSHFTKLNDIEKKSLRYLKKCKDEHYVGLREMVWVIGQIQYWDTSKLTKSVIRKELKNMYTSKREDVRIFYEYLHKCFMSNGVGKFMDEVSKKENREVQKV